MQLTVSAQRLQPWIAIPTTYLLPKALQQFLRNLKGSREA